MGRIITFNGNESQIMEFANDTQLGSLRIQDEVLTQIAQGYRNAEMAAPLLFPVVGVDQESGRFPAFGNEAWQIFTTTRALRGQVNRMEVAYSNVTLTLAEHSLGFAIDRRELKAFNGDPTMLRTVRQNQVMDALDLDRENSLASALVTSGTYASTNKLNASTKAYLGADDLYKDITTAKWAIASAVGKMPNVIIFSPAAYQIAIESPSIVDRVKYGAAGTADFTGRVNSRTLAEVLEIPTVMVPKVVKKADGSSGAVSFVWDQTQTGNIILAWVGNGYGVPSFGYSYRLNGFPLVESYYDQRVKSDVYEEQRIYADAITLATAGYLMYNVAA